jgi:hypothetical protein
VRVAIACGVLLACQQTRTPAHHDDAARARDAMVIDAALAPSVDAGTVPCRGDDSATRTFYFGTLTAPAGWCWRRTEEGDDMSGVLLDDHTRVRMRYDELAHRDTVPDTCKGGRAIRDAAHNGIAYRTCTLADGRHCYTFHGLANVCTESAEDLDLTATLAKKR